MTSLYADDISEARRAAAFWMCFVTEWEEAPAAKRKELQKKFGPLISCEVPKFHEEFELPIGVPSDLAVVYREALRAGYAAARTQPWLKAQWMKDDARHGDKSKPYYDQVFDMLRRYRDPAAGVWLYEQLEKNPGYKPNVLDFKDDPPRGMPGVKKRDDDLEYSSDVRSSFSNHPTQRDVLTWGTTHVAIGFNDLLVLVRAHYTGPMEGATSSKKTLRFVGIDMNAYSVAKTEVVWEMLMTTRVTIPQVIQVWFSATWTNDTLAAFTEAVKGVLMRKRAESGRAFPSLREGIRVRVEGLTSDAGRLLNGREGTVTRFLADSGRWGVRIDGQLDLKVIKPECLRSAVALDSVTSKGEPSSVYPGCRVKVDGLQSDAGRLLNGQSGVATRFSSESDRWSVQMEHPEKASKMIKEANLQRASVSRRAAGEESVMAYLEHWATVGVGQSASRPPLSLEEARVAWWKAQVQGEPDRKLYFIGSLQRARDRQAAARRRESLDVMELFTEIMHESIAASVRQKGAEFSAEFICDHLSSKNTDLLAKIDGDYKPWTMSWSNVADYMKMSEFHEVARRCSSGGDTLHFGYSMNWGLETQGTHIIDYLASDNGASRPKTTRAYWLDRAQSDSGHERTWGCRFPNSEKEAQTAYEIFLTKPLRDDPENLTGYHLALDHYGNWLRGHFEKKAEHPTGKEGDTPWYLTKDNKGIQLGPANMNLHSPFQRVSTSIHVCWTYDPWINIQSMK
eukprot:gene12224-14435_t